jgi:hypothetical protein
MGLIVGITWTSTALILFAGLAVALSSDGIQTFDAAIRLSIHLCASPTLTKKKKKVTVLGSVTFLGAAFVIAIAGFLIAGWRESAVALTWTMAGAVLLENGMKYAFHRVRPEPFLAPNRIPTVFRAAMPCFRCAFIVCWQTCLRAGFKAVCPCRDLDRDRPTDRGHRCFARIPRSSLSDGCYWRIPRGRVLARRVGVD